MYNQRGYKGVCWGDLHVWSPREIKEQGLDYDEVVRFGRQNSEHIHQRCSDELPAGVDMFEFCSMSEARKAGKQRHLTFQEVDCYLTRVRGVPFAVHNLPRPERWGEQWATMVPEPTNEEDPFAISVEVEGKRIGYVKASLAANLQWIVRALMSDGYECVTPCFIEHFSSVWIALPTGHTWEGRFGLDRYYRDIRKLWDSIPEDVALAEIRKLPYHPSKEAADELWKFRAEAPHFFPAEPCADDFSIVWHQVFQEMRHDYWDAENERKRIENEGLNQQIVNLYSTGLPMTAVGKKLHISVHRVRKGLVDSNVEIDRFRSVVDPSKAERDDKIVALYESGCSQYFVAKKLGIKDSTVRNVLVRRGVELRKRTNGSISYVADNKPQRLNNEERDARNKEIVRRYNEGQSQGSLARHFNLDRKTVRTILRKANVSFHVLP